MNLIQNRKNLIVFRLICTNDIPVKHVSTKKVAMVNCEERINQIPRIGAPVDCSGDLLAFEAIFCGYISCLRR